MRVVAGSAGGLALDAPPGRGTRPTSDRVREAIFNALDSLGAVHDARVVDLFAGSGALGIEALSRGARSATFVEQDRAALRILRQNLDRCGFGERATVVGAPVQRWLDGRVAGTADVDLVLADPPYAFDEWQGLLERVAAPLVVIESDREVALPPGWGVTRSRRYGSTFVLFARAPEPS